MKLFSSDLSESDIKRLNAGIKKGEPDECWEWQKGLKTGGYASYAFTSKRLNKLIQIGGHRAIALIKYQVLESEDFAMHTCDNPKCCNPEHIIKGSCKQNTQDACLNGLIKHAKGSQHGRSILVEDQVHLILQFLNEGKPQAEIARFFNVSPSAIADIKHGRRWKHLTKIL